MVTIILEKILCGTASLNIHFCFVFAAYGWDHKKGVWMKKKKILPKVFGVNNWKNTYDIWPTYYIWAYRSNIIWHVLKVYKITPQEQLHLKTLSDLKKHILRLGEKYSSLKSPPDYLTNRTLTTQERSIIVCLRSKTIRGKT